MNACPVSLDIDRHLAEIDDADRFDNMVEVIKSEYSAKDAAGYIDDHLADTGGDALIAMLGELAVAPSGLTSSVAIARVRDALDAILTTAAQAEAKNRLEEWDGEE